MSYTVTKLITNAYYLTGIVSRRLQTVTGDQISDGLDLLNDVVGIKSAQTRLIPYYKEYKDNLVQGQEKYFIPGLLLAETFTFNIGDVRFATAQMGRRAYQGTSRVDNIKSLPFNWHLERTLNGSNLFVYMLPSDNYSFKVWGKFGLDQVTLNQDLEATYDRFYIAYLRYALAEYLAEDYNITLQPQHVQKLREIEGILMDVSPPDLTMSKVSTLTTQPAAGWGFVNLGKGFVPS